VRFATEHAAKREARPPIARSLLHALASHLPPTPTPLSNPQILQQLRNTNPKHLNRRVRLKSRVPLQLAPLRQRAVQMHPLLRSTQACERELDCYVLERWQQRVVGELTCEPAEVGVVTALQDFGEDVDQFLENLAVVHPVAALGEDGVDAEAGSGPVGGDMTGLYVTMVRGRIGTRVIREQPVCCLLGCV